MHTNFATSIISGGHLLHENSPRCTPLLGTDRYCTNRASTLTLCFLPTLTCHHLPTNIKAVDGLHPLPSINLLCCLITGGLICLHTSAFAPIPQQSGISLATDPDTSNTQWSHFCCPTVPKYSSSYTTF